MQSKPEFQAKRKITGLGLGRFVLLPQPAVGPYESGLKSLGLSGLYKPTKMQGGREQGPIPPDKQTPGGVQPEGQPRGGSARKAVDRSSEIWPSERTRRPDWETFPGGGPSMRDVLSMREAAALPAPWRKLSGHRPRGTRPGPFRSMLALYSPLRSGPAQPAALGSASQTPPQEYPCCSRRKPQSKQNPHARLRCLKQNAARENGARRPKWSPLRKVIERTTKGSACFRPEPVLEPGCSWSEAGKLLPLVSYRGKLHPTSSHSSEYT